MELYLSNFSAQIRPERHVALVIDNAGWHTAKDLDIPDNITLIPLSPYSPELNAMEQVWIGLNQIIYAIFATKIMKILLRKHH